MHDHWRNKIKVHPAADMFPMMSDAELDALAKEIAEHGMHQGIVLWTREWANSVIKNGWKADFEAGKVPCGLSLLDGRNRLAAIKRAFDDPEQRKAALSHALFWGGAMAPGVLLAWPRYLNAHTDPFAFVISANLH